VSDSAPKKYRGSQPSFSSPLRNPPPHFICSLNISRQQKQSQHPLPHSYACQEQKQKHTTAGIR
jgi:hypothetical protein